MTARRPVAVWVRSRSTASASRWRSTSRSTSSAASRMSVRLAPDPDVDAVAQPLAQVRVQRRLDGAGHAGRRADGEVLERLLLEHVERDVGRVAEVGGGQRVDVAGHVALVAVAAGVVVAGQLVEQVAVVDQLAELEHEHAGPLLVDEQHAEALELLGHRLELRHRRRLVDHHPAAHRHRQRDDLPEVVGRAGEDGQAARGRCDRCRPCT